MNIVTFGGGTNSTAMILGIYEKNIPIDYILFCDTGSEQPHTYKHRDVFNKWLIVHKMPEIITLYYTNKDGDVQSLEQDLLKSSLLPAPCFMGKSCSLKYKTSVVDKWCRHNDKCKAVWDKGEKVNKYIGFDAGEENRKDNAYKYDILDKKFNKIYPLIDWEWYRADCINIIKKHGLELPGKSSCFFCPNMKKPEIRLLYKNNKDLFDRAVTLEEKGLTRVNSPAIKGLGRSFAWKNFVDGELGLTAICDAFGDEDDGTMPCSCYDG